jgi:N-ethylmaleimide reductase
VRLAHPVQGVDAREDEVMSEYRSAAENAGDAGFDGVEVHAGEGACAAGPDARALLEVVDTLCGVFGAGRVAVCLRLDADAPPATRLAARELRERPLAFVHLARDAAPALVVTAPEAAQAASGVMSSDTPPVLTPGCGAREAARLIESGAASAVGFDALFVANPDLPRRLFEGLDLARCDAATLLDGAAAGYVDYPVA